MFFKIVTRSVVAAALLVAVWPALPSHAQSDTANAILEAARASAAASEPAAPAVQAKKAKPTTTVQEVKQPVTPTLTSATAEPAKPATEPRRTMNPPKPQKRKFRIDPTVSAYYPTDDKTIDAFGNGWLGFGISFGLDNEIVRKSSFDLRIEGIAKNNDNGHAYIIPIGVAFTQRMAVGRSFKPYIGAGVNAYVVDVESKTDNVDSGAKVTPGGCVFVGTSIGSGTKLEASYYAMSDVDSFDLGGAKLSVSVRF